MSPKTGSGIEGKPRKATPEQVADFYEKLRAGTPEEKLGATAKYFRKSPRAIKQSIKFWWPGKKFLKEFGERVGRGPRWDMPSDKLLAALNQHETVAATAKFLKTTPITLKKAIDRKGIVQRWTLDSGSRNGG